jgi:hypothetical protein
METISKALLSLALAGTLNLLAACKNRPETVAEGKASKASQGTSAEGIVIIGLSALKNLRECREHPDAPCAFRDRAQASRNRMKIDPSSSPAHGDGP